jgi:hypothetical protein
MPPEGDKVVMTDVPDEKLESAVRLLVESSYEKIVIEVQDKRKQTYRLTAD